MKKNAHKETDNKEELLLLALQRSDRKAYVSLFYKYYPILCAYCHKFVSLEDSEEIAQDVLLWLWEKRKELAIKKTLSQYLFKMTYHKAMNKIANTQVINKANTIFFEQMQEMLQNTDFFQWEELQISVQNAIKKLPDSYREAFVRHRFQHKSYKEIAEELQVSPKTVDYRIRQSLKLLQDDLKEYLPILFLYL